MVDKITTLKGKLYKMSRQNEKLSGKLKNREKKLKELEIKLNESYEIIKGNLPF